MDQRRQRIADKHKPDEQRQPILLAEFHQHQIGADIGHDIGRRDPGGLFSRQPQCPLEEGEVGGDQRVTKAAGQAGKNSDRSVGPHAIRRVIGIERRSRNYRSFMRLELIGLCHRPPPEVNNPGT